MPKATRRGRAPAGASPEAKFWWHVDKGAPDDCWPWAGPTDDGGYGIFCYTDENGKQRRTRAHRWLLGHLRGRPLTRDVVGKEDGCHQCDNPPCCNPEHLYVGTRAQNIGDAIKRGRMAYQKITHCAKCGTELTCFRGSKRRRCKVCVSARERKARQSRKTCKYGHLLSGDNLIIVKNGKRRCRICTAARTEAVRASFARRREAREEAA